MTMAGDRQSADFGATMKRAREGRGISLREIAVRTKISVGALEALERNDISRLPGGIFSRAFVRSYAAEIGLDPEETVRDFLTQFPHDSVTAGSPHVPQEDHAAIESDRRSAETAVKLIAMSVPLAGAILYFTLWYRPAAAPSLPARVAASRPVAVAAADSGEPLSFEILASAPVAIELDVDGARRAARALVAGERLVFQATREISLGMSDASVVQLVINGQPAVALGRPGERRTVHIGRQSYGSFLAPH